MEPIAPIAALPKDQLAPKQPHIAPLKQMLAQPQGFSCQGPAKLPELRDRILLT